MFDIIDFMSKFQKYFLEMVESHKELFDHFKKTHAEYVETDGANQEEFNTLGAQVMEIVRDYEKLLTSKSDSTSYAKFSSNLSDKFMDQVRRVYPKIDFIGVLSS